MHEAKAKLEHIKDEIERGLETLDFPRLRDQLAEYQKQMQEPGFWDDQERAKEVSRHADQIQKQMEEWKNAAQECDGLLELLPTIHPEKDPKSAEEFDQMLTSFEKRWHALSVQTFLNGKYDANNVIISIHTGTGGKDAQDFTQMLLRMYLRYAEREGFETQILDSSAGEEVGLKSATFTVKGHLAYGYLKGESGVHRLIRISPFNAKHTRETSFSLVEVLPEIPPVDVGEIPKDDMKIETYRAGGAGGQHVNTTDSAVRIIHIPTGITVQCQNERSQIQNREQAMKVLHARLVAFKEKQQVETISELKGKKVEMSWGHQIRSYTLHPYTLVKDHRTNYEETNVEKVLDGDLEGFITAFIEKGKG